MRVLGIAAVAGFLLAGGTWTVADETVKSSFSLSSAAVSYEPAPTTEVLIFLNPGTNARAYAAGRGLTLKYGLQSDPNAFVFVAPTVAAAEALVGKANRDSRVREAWLNQTTQQVRFSFVPNDPYFPQNGGGSGQPGQWHLINSVNPAIDANVQGAWNANVTGAGVLIGIVDDSLETAHPDLAANYVAAHSYNFGSYTGKGAANNPNPYNSDDQHGVSVAGVAAARGGNSIGVSGAAPYAGLAGLRIDWPTQSGAMFADAVLYHSSGADTSIKIKNHSYGYSAPYVETAATNLEESALATSTAAGTIHVYAAGNSRGGAGQDSNKMDTQNSPNAITVAALGSNGVYASYSSFGAAVVVTAPSNTSGGWGITTTDRTGSSYGYNGFTDDDYTDTFGGTSSATPLVSGVLALVKEVQPNLNTRFAKHLLARTSVIVDPTDSTATSDGGWKTNGAGFHYNQNYGFGLIDAAALVQQATQYSGVTDLKTWSSGTRSVGASLPDNNINGVTRTLEVAIADVLPLEEVLVTLSVTHSFRGDLEAYLTSPDGTTSRLMYRSAADGTDNLSWEFVSHAFWGEMPNGIWSLKVADVLSIDQGTWNSYSLDLRMGTLEAVPEPAALGLLPLAMVVLARRRRA